ncbi:MAG: chorismate--pyruvate lyase [Lachnospiraceae bacterium]|nr:chorismate--pyruvate lyase [Lachnospiraceae bacterium]
MILEAIYYTVETIEGDYANLRRTDAPEEEPKLVARALLPEGIFEGCRVKYELMQYSMAD